MASGFETRQSGRATFASQGPAVKQIGRGTASDTHRGAEIVGGGAAAGGAPNAQIQEVGNITGQLGDFMAKAMQPYVERRQQEQFVEGLTRAQAGESIDELAKSRKGVVGALFGPTSLAQGAQYYEAVRKVDQWDIDMNSRMDELKQLDPKELAKEISGSWTGMLGDDPYINQMVSKQMIEKVGPRTDLVTKARYTWQQDTARKGMHDSLSAAAGSLQGVASQVVDYTDPTDEEATALTASRQNFLGRFQQPVGMSDDTYKATLTASLISMAQEGNWYGYTALSEAGVLDVLDDEQQTKVLSSYDRFKGKSLEDAKGKYVEELLAIDVKINKREMSPAEAAAAVDEINAKIMRDTGLTERAYDSQYLISTGKGVVSMLAADANRVEEREYQEGREIAREEREEARKVREEQEKFGAANTAFTMGQARTFITNDGDRGSLGRASHQAYLNGDFGAFAKNFRQENWMDNNVAKLMQSKLTSAGGTTFTGEAAQGYREFEALYKLDKGAAMAYYGPQASKLLFMRKMVNGGATPEIAYQRAFASEDVARFTGQTLRPSDRKATIEALAEHVDDASSGMFTSSWGLRERQMGANAKNVLLNVSAETAADYQRNSDESPEQVARMAFDRARSSNAFEYYGGNMAWRNGDGQKRISEVIKTTDKKAGDLLYSLIDERFKGMGVRDGADGDYSIHRVPIRGGGFVLTVTSSDPEHSTPVMITDGELRAKAAADARGEVKGNQPHKYNGVNTHRRIPGETGLQRVIRQNREVKAGADPVNHNLSQ